MKTPTMHQMQVANSAAIDAVAAKFIPAEDFRAYRNGYAQALALQSYQEPQVYGDKRQEVYHSSTLGRIPLSFTGRRLMQNLREAFQDFVRAARLHEKAIAIASIQHEPMPVNDVSWAKVSEARGRIVEYMSKLEGKQPVEPDIETPAFKGPYYFQGMVCNQNLDGTWEWKPDRVSEIQPSPEKLSADLAAATAHRACCGSEHDTANRKLHGYCVVCGVPWPCDTAKHFLRGQPK